MTSRTRTARVFAAAAMAGLMAGAVSSLEGCQKSPPPSSSAGMSSDSGSKAMLAKHDCKGMNACKGQGGCSSGDNGCKGKNSCKGKGGCSTSM